MTVLRCQSVVRRLLCAAALTVAGCSGDSGQAELVRHDPAAHDGGDCFGCHDSVRSKMTVSRRVHAPAGRDCLICHEVHGGDPSIATPRPIDAGCFRCHADIEAAVTGVAMPHGAVTTQAQCGNCHDPHASNELSLLRDRQDVVCLGCHDRAVRAADGRTIPDMAPALRERAFVHGPIGRGQCTACHNVHGGTQSRLLKQRFTARFYADFALEQYALCFECHTESLVTAERTVQDTRFRDGDRNLHYLHVHRQEKGRTCRACHELHGSDLPALVAESVAFEGSDWAMPIGFKPTATGGSCAPGCHVPMEYDRGVER